MKSLCLFAVVIVATYVAGTKSTAAPPPPPPVTTKPPPTQDCFEGDGSYRGTTARSVSNMPCKRWSDFSKISLMKKYFPNKNVDNNHCRNIKAVSRLWTGYQDKPFCWVGEDRTQPFNLKLESCDIPHCWEKYCKLKRAFIRGYPIRTQHGSNTTARGCRKECDATPDCTAFTYSRGCGRLHDLYSVNEVNYFCNKYCALYGDNGIQDVWDKERPGEISAFKDSSNRYANCLLKATTTTTTTTKKPNI